MVDLLDVNLTYIKEHMYSVQTVTHLYARWKRGNASLRMREAWPWEPFQTTVHASLSLASSNLCLFVILKRQLQA
jgi:hypothetical protein